MEKGSLIVISAPSGTGKGTICNEIFRRRDNVIFSVSMTTRKPRDGEVHGEDYYFVSKKEFIDNINNQGFLEYAQVFGNYYGTPAGEVVHNLNQGRDVLLEIDVQGAMSVKKSYPEAILIFILPPSMKELEKRIANRGTETKDSMEKRLGEALNEMERARDYNYIVVNDELENAVEDVLAIMRSDKLKVKENKVDLTRYK